ncbi:MAG: hypothetical protein R6X20_02060 [Phycisphaerae bacterium]
MRLLCPLSLLAAALVPAVAARAGEPSPAPRVYERPKGTVVPVYRYVGQDAVGKVAFYSEYNAQHDEPRHYRGDRASWIDNLEVITAYSTFFPITLRSAGEEPEKFDRAIDLTRRAFQRRQLISYVAYGTKGVNTLGRVLDRLETMPDGQAMIRNVFAALLGDEPYLGGRSREEMEDLIACFDAHIQSRYPHIQSWLNFAVSTPDIKTWGTGRDGRQPLPAGLEILSIDYYAYLGNGTQDGWGHRDFRKVEPAVLAFLKRFLDEQTRRLKQAIAAVYPKGQEPMLILYGNSAYVCGSTHPTPVSIQDAYFEYVRRTEWAGLQWWTFEDYKDMIGGRRHEILRSHQRHGRRLRQEKLY